MGMFNKKKETTESAVISDKNLSSAEGTPAAHTPADTPRVARSLNGSAPEHHDHSPEEVLDNLPATKLAVTLGAIASIGGFMFGYESGQISGLFSLQYGAGAMKF